MKKIKSKKKGRERRAAQKAERARQSAAQLLVNQANAQVSSKTDIMDIGNSKIDYALNCCHSH